MINEFIPGSGLTNAPEYDKGEPEYNLARKAKDAGMSAKHYVKMRTDALRLTGRVLKWDSSIYDQAYLALALIVAEVWGPKQ